MKKEIEIDFGLCKVNNLLRKVKITYTWDGVNFSASGEIGNDMFGQCLEEIANLPELINNELCQRIVNVWRYWHLNDLNAGTIEQKAELNRRKTVENLYFLPNYETQCQWLKDANLYEVPLTSNMKATGDFPEDVQNGKRGYRYGERWLHHKIPDYIANEIDSWEKI